VRPSSRYQKMNKLISTKLLDIFSDFKSGILDSGNTPNFD
jgi:hypothetical protein